MTRARPQRPLVPCTCAPSTRRSSTRVWPPDRSSACSCSRRAACLSGSDVGRARKPSRVQSAHCGVAECVRARRCSASTRGELAKPSELHAAHIRDRRSCVCVLLTWCVHGPCLRTLVHRTHGRDHAPRGLRQSGTTHPRLHHRLGVRGRLVRDNHDATAECAVSLSNDALSRPSLRLQRCAVSPAAPHASPALGRLT